MVPKMICPPTEWNECLLEAPSRLFGFTLFPDLVISQLKSLSDLKAQQPTTLHFIIFISHKYYPLPFHLYCTPIYHGGRSWSLQYHNTPEIIAFLLTNG